MRNICAEFRKPGASGPAYWSGCNCADCTKMRDALTAAGHPQVQFDRALGPEKGESRQHFIEHTLGLTTRHGT